MERHRAEAQVDDGSMTMASAESPLELAVPLGKYRYMNTIIPIDPMYTVHSSGSV